MGERWNTESGRGEERERDNMDGEGRGGEEGVRGERGEEERENLHQ